MSIATLALAQAASNIRRYGTDCTVSHRTQGTGPDATGDAVVSVTSQAILDQSSLIRLGAKFGADLIRGGDMMVSVAASLGFIPAPGDTVVTMGETYTVVAAKALVVQGMAVMYDLLVRR